MSVQQRPGPGTAGRDLPPASLFLTPRLFLVPIAGTACCSGPGRSKTDHRAEMRRVSRQNPAGSESRSVSCCRERPPRTKLPPIGHRRSHRSPIGCLGWSSLFASRTPPKLKMSHFLRSDLWETAGWSGRSKPSSPWMQRHDFAEVPKSSGRTFPSSLLSYSSGPRRQSRTNA
jgi:hypothetical protein